MIVQTPPPAIEPPENAIDAAPATGAKAGAPQPLTEAAGTAATFIAPGAVGSRSVNATPLIACVPFGLLSWIVTVEIAPVPIVPGLNDLATTGGASVASTAFAVLPVNALGVVAVTAVEVLL